MNLRNNNRGTTLIELIVVISVAGFLAFMAGVGIMIFFAKWTELNLYSDLQIDAFNAMYSMKHGVVAGSSEDADFLGIASADSVRFINQSGGANNYTGIMCLQSTGEQIHNNDYVEFWWDAWDGVIKMRYSYGVEQQSRPTVIFPIEHKDDITVTNLSFRAGNNQNDVVLMTLEARIKISDNKVRKVKYQTYVAIGIT